MQFSILASLDKKCLILRIEKAEFSQCLSILSLHFPNILFWSELKSLKHKTKNKQKKVLGSQVFLSVQIKTGISTSKQYSRLWKFWFISQKMRKKNLWLTRGDLDLFLLVCFALNDVSCCCRVGLSLVRPVVLYVGGLW